MSKYISIKLVEATSTTNVIPGPNAKNGYFVTDEYGNCAHYNESAFKKHNLKLEDNKELSSGVSISSEMVKNFIDSYEVIERGKKTTIVHAKLKNGFCITESSSCVDPANYDLEIGIQCCLERIENKIWELLGFLLQSAYKGVGSDD